jgi:hypothetical protein
MISAPLFSVCWLIGMLLMMEWCFRHQLLVGSRKLIRLQYVTAEFGVTNSGWLQIGSKCFCQIEIRTSHQQ